MILLLLEAIRQTYHHLNHFFMAISTQDFGMLKYFFGGEVIRSKRGIFLSQNKYVLDLLFETGKLRVKSCSSPMAPSLQLTREGELLGILRNTEDWIGS